MRLYFLKIVVFGLICIKSIASTETCCSERRCECIRVQNITNIRYEVRCVDFRLDLSSFPRFFNNVQTVTLKNNSLMDMPIPVDRYFPKSLKTLFVINNFLNYLTRHTFHGLKNLQHIDLESNRLMTIENGTFSHLLSLQILVLNNNPKLTFRILRNITYDLQFTNIRILRLDSIHCASGITTIVYKSDIEYLSNTSLREISLNRNRIGYFEPGAISAVPKTINSASFKHNDLALGSYIFEVEKVTGLTYLHAGYRQIFSGFAEGFCKDWRGPKGVNIPWNTTIQYPIRLPPNLKELTFPYSNVMTSKSLPSLKFCENNSLEKLEVQGNTFSNWDNPLLNLHKLKYWDISNNGAVTLSNTFFSFFPVLETLKINNNFLGPVLKFDENGRVFKSLNTLKHLEIANNGIDNLPPHIFKFLYSLEYLDLSQNYISDWNVSLVNLKHLRFLDLSSNRISRFSDTTMDEISHRSYQINVSLQHNVLQCSCDTLKFLRWISKNSHIFVQYNSYQCQDELKRTISFANISSEINSLEAKCSNFNGLIIGSFLSVVLCIVMSIIGILYRYRWSLRYMYYTGLSKFKKDYKTDHQYEFDAFISYADEDRESVIEIAMKLENKYKLKLQLHQRDFLAGRSIAENIIDTIHECHKTVIMLSKNFIKSYWCMYEFNMAHMESAYSRGGRDVIIIVLLETMNSRDIPVTMMDVIRSDSYAEYSDSEQGQLLFWEKLCTAIKTP